MIGLDFRENPESDRTTLGATGRQDLACQVESCRVRLGHGSSHPLQGETRLAPALSPNIIGVGNVCYDMSLTNWLVARGARSGRPCRRISSDDPRGHVREHARQGCRVPTLSTKSGALGDCRNQQFRSRFGRGLRAVSQRWNPGSGWSRPSQGTFHPVNSRTRWPKTDSLS